MFKKGIYGYPST